MKKEEKRKNGHVAIYMSQFVNEKLDDLALRLNMPRSKVVNHLICLADASQDLQVLIQKIDTIPGECTKSETETRLYHVYIILSNFYIQLKNEMMNEKPLSMDEKAAIEIATSCRDIYE